MQELEENLVSVVIPTYNRSATIGRAISSVLKQTYRNIEIIVVDDNSNDDTSQVVESFNDPRIKYLKHSTNKGGGASRNTGIKNAKGAYIAFQDSDDEWEPDKLSVQLPVFDKYIDIGVVFCQMIRIYDTHNLIVPSKEVSSTGDFHKDIFLFNYVGTPSAVVRKELLTKINGFDENLPRLQDWDIFIRLSGLTGFNFVQKPLVKVYMQENSVTKNAEYLKKSLDIFYTKYQKNIGNFNHQHQSEIYNTYGSMLMKEGKVSDGRKFLKLAFLNNPLNLKNDAQFFLSLLGTDLYSMVRKLSK